MKASYLLFIYVLFSYLILPAQASSKALGQDNLVRYSNSRQARKFLLIDELQVGNLIDDKTIDSSANHQLNIKIDPISFMYYSTSFSIEKSVKRGKSMELGLGLIGLGLNLDYSNQRIPQGVFIKLSYKFLVSQILSLKHKKHRLF